MVIRDEIHDQLSRQTFLGQTSAGLGTIALASLLNPANLFCGTLAPGQMAATTTPDILDLDGGGRHEKRAGF